MVYESKLSKRLEKVSGLVLTSVHVGLVEKTSTKRDPFSTTDKPYKYLQDNWTVTVSYDGKSYSTSYFSGIGHRKLIRSAKKEGNRYWDNIFHMYKTEKEACEAQWLKLIPPSLADVMYCLLSDGRGAEDTFENFASEYGYDTDSRKALEIYLKCQETRNGMINVLGRKLFEELSQLEH